MTAVSTTMVTEIVRALTVNKSKFWVFAPTMSGEKGVRHGDNHKREQGGQPDLDEVVMKYVKMQGNG